MKKRKRDKVQLSPGVEIEFGKHFKLVGQRIVNGVPTFDLEYIGPSRTDAPPPASKQQ